MTDSPQKPPDAQLQMLQRRLERERTARKEAERILEQKAQELYEANQELVRINAGLEAEAQRRASELKASQRNFQQIVENVADVIFTTSANGTIQYMNEAGLNLLGMELDQLQRTNYLALVLPTHQKEVASFIAYELALKKESSYLEFPVVDRGGKLHWLGLTAQYSYHEGRLKEVHSIARDITDRRMVEEKLKRSEEKYRGIIENMELGLMEVNREGKIIRAYEHFCKMVGYEASELVGQDANELLLPEGYEDQMAAQFELRDMGKQSLYELEVKHKSGRRIWVLISGAPVYNDLGKVTGSIGIHYDITARKLTEQELARARDEAEHAKEAEKEFLARMSHEIRTPMNAVIGMAHLLHESELSAEQDELVSSVLHSANLLKGLINSVLDLSKIQAGKVELNPRDFNLQELAVSLQKTFEFRMAGTQVEVRMEFSPELPLRAFGDELVINQVCVNLLGNAAKFTREGHILLKLSPVDLGPENLGLSIEVEDTGMGMSPEQLERIFDRFRQATSEIAHTHGGSGLGLAITDELVRLMNGTITVCSEAGKGSTFKVTLPLKPAQSNTVPEPAPAQEVDLSHLRILVAEDNPMNISYLEKLLVRWNTAFVFTRDGQEAVEASRKTAFDVILMDIQMPVMGGMQATRVIRSEADNPNRQTPIVALSAQAFEEDVRHALEQGMSSYLTKPYTPVQLQQELSRHAQRGPAIAHASEPATFTFASGLNNDYLHEFYGGDLEYTSLMFGEFLKNIPELLEHVETASDAALLRKALHKLKPTLPMVGLTELYEVAGALEAVVGTSPLLLDKEVSDLAKSIRKWIPVLKTEHQRLLDAQSHTP